MFRILIALLILAGVTRSACGEELYELVGDTFLVSSGTIEFEGCEYDKSYTVGMFVFVCQSYGYAYAYGDAKIVAREFEYQGKKHISAYLCIEGEDECHDGTVFRIR